MTDFASESLGLLFLLESIEYFNQNFHLKGGNIMFTRCTETYREKARWLTVLNYPIFQINSSPRIIIQVREEKRQNEVLLIIFFLESNTSRELLGI
jgi:hypothetical protein